MVRRPNWNRQPCRINTRTWDISKISTWLNIQIELTWPGAFISYNWTLFQDLLPAEIPHSKLNELHFMKLNSMKMKEYLGWKCNYTKIKWINRHLNREFRNIASLNGKLIFRWKRVYLWPNCVSSRRWIGRVWMKIKSRESKLTITLMLQYFLKTPLNDFMTRKNLER